MIINNKTIIKDNSPLIREHSLPVSLPLTKEDEELLKEMYQYVEDSIDEEKAEKMDLTPSVGISAIQVGVKKQLTAIIVHTLDKNENEVTYRFMLANPKIISRSVQKAYLKDGEGCLSVKGKHEGYVVRNARITVQAYDLITNANITIRARGYLAIVLQHEIDHFSGKLYYDYIDSKNPFPVIENAIEI